MQYGTVTAGTSLGGASVSFTQYTPSESLPTKLARAKRTPEERLLQKYNVTDAKGNVTDAGFELVKQMLFEQNRDAILDQLKTIEAAEKAEKETN